MNSAHPSVVERFEEWQWSLDGRLLDLSRDPLIVRQSSRMMNGWFDLMALSGAHLPWHPATLFAEARQAAALVAARAVAPPVAPTACDILDLPGSASLRHYAARKNRKNPGSPLLIVNSLINRHYIFDLHAGRSFISFLNDAGFEVFSLDWGNPGVAERTAGLEHFADTVISEAVERMAEESGAEKVHLLGYSMGGVLATTFAALFPEKVTSLILLGTPSDFARDEPLRSWMEDETFDPGKIARMFGNLPGWLVGASFRSVKPVTAMTKPMLALLEPGELATHLATDVWLADAPAIPGALYAAFINAYYRENALWNGTLRLNDRIADLGAVACPVLNLYGTRDQIVNPASAAALGERVARYREHAVPMGHLGLTIGRGATANVWPVVRDWLADPDR